MLVSDRKFSVIVMNKQQVDMHYRLFARKILMLDCILMLHALFILLIRFADRSLDKKFINTSRKTLIAFSSFLILIFVMQSLAELLSTSILKNFCILNAAAVSIRLRCLDDLVFILRVSPWI